MFYRLVLSRLVATFSALLVFSIACALGVWQLNRMQQKIDLASAISAVEAQLPLRASAEDWDLKSAQYHRMSAKGRFITDRTIFLENRPHPKGVDPKTGISVGYYVMTPLILESSDRVLWVNRGWLPRRTDDRQLLPSVTTPSSLIEIEGVVFDHPPRVMELGGRPEGSVVQNFDFQKYPFSEKVFPFVLRQTTATPDELSRDWAPLDSGAQRHQGYAFQWFALAGLTLSFWLLSGLMRKKID